MRELLPFLMIAGMAAVFALFMWLLVRWERKQANIWTPVTDGVYDRVEYGYYMYSQRSGAMVHTTSHHRMDVTAVHFQDGRSYVMNGRKDMPFPRGTNIRISRNGLGGHRLESLA